MGAMQALWPGLPVDAAATPSADGGHSRRLVDADLIRRTLAGDRTATRDLHRHYFPVARSFLRRLGTRTDEIEDACQEVFLQFFRYLGSFRGEAELKTWLFRLCITEARRILQRRKVRSALAGLLRREPPSCPLPPTLQSEATIQDLVTRALDRMSPAQRLAFILFELEGMTGKQVAETAGRSLPSTFRHLHEARRVFIDTLDAGKHLPD